MKIFDLPISQIYVIQGVKNPKIISDLPQYIQWIPWKDENILQDQLIIGKNFQNLLNLLGYHKILQNSLIQDMNIISDALDLTQSYKNNFPIVLDKFRKHSDFYAFFVGKLPFLCLFCRRKVS